MQCGYSQLEVYLDDLVNVDEIEVYDDYLFFSYHENGKDIFAYSDLRIDTPKIQIIKELSSPILDFAIEGDYIYYTIYNREEQAHVDTIYQLNYRNPNATIFRLISEITAPEEIAVEGDRLLVSAEAFNSDFDTIIEYDLESLDSPPIVLVDSIRVTDMEIYNDELFYSTLSRTCVYRFNTNDNSESLLDCLFGAINGIAIGSDLLFASNALVEPGSEGFIVSYDLKNENDTFTTIINDVSTPTKLAYHNNYLYAYELLESRIVRFKLENSVSTNNQEKSFNVVVYPNPSFDMIFFRSANDLGRESIYELYNNAGQMVGSGDLIFDTLNGLDISSLPNGAYYVKLFIGEKIVIKKVMKI